MPKKRLKNLKFDVNAIYEKNHIIYIYMIASLNLISFNFEENWIRPCKPPQ